jgi:ABC-type multidrug transport system fused ATPase/permease subunit
MEPRPKSNFPDLAFPRLPPELCWLAKQIRPLLYWHLGSFLCIVVASLLALLPPLALGWLIDKILPGRQITQLLGLVVLLLLSYQGRATLTSLGSYLTMTAAQRTSLELRMSLVRHLDMLSAEHYEATPVGNVIYPLQEPVDQIAYFGSDLLPSILRLVLAVTFTTTTMFTLSPLLTLTIFPLVLSFVITRSYFRQKLAVASESVQQSQIAWSSLLHEHFAAVTSIQLLCQEKRQERRLFQLLGRLIRSQRGLFKTGVAFALFTSLSLVVAMSVSVLVGGREVFAGSLSAGRLVTFYSLIVQLFEPLSGASEIYSRTQQAFANIRQVRNTLLERPVIVDRFGSVPFSSDLSSELEVSELTFRYRTRNEGLDIASLRFLPGEQVAVVGENGGGKTTLAKLMVRMYDLESGSICIGGHDIRNIQMESLRRNVCYLPRDPALFHGTVASNLRFAKPAASNLELERALRRAGLSVFVDAIANPLQQDIGPNGCKLSGGQRQRLAIARALLLQPRILVLDESTSCLDPASETLVLRNIRRSLPATTLIVITHRFSTASEFPRVLVFSDGRIIADDAPDRLIAHCDVFSRLFTPQSPTENQVFSS